MKNILILFTLALACTFTGQGQTQPGGRSQSKLSEIINAEEAGLVEFKPNVKLTPGELFLKYKEDFGLTIADELKVKKVEKDDLGFTHYWYEQFHNKVKIEGAEYTVHEKNGSLVAANGNIIGKLVLNAKATLSPKAAVEVALAHVNARRYKWENDAKYYPKPELMFAQRDPNQFDPAQYTLAYKIPVYSLEPFAAVYVYVDANSGQVIRTLTALDECNGGTVNTLYNGSQGLSTEATSATQFRLRASCAATCGTATRTIHTRNFNGGNPVEITNTGNNWDGTAGDARRVGATTQWALERTYDYFLCRHNRNSYDGNGAAVNAFINNNSSSGGRDNAFWLRDEQTVNFGSGSGGATNGALVSLDIVGHEFTHGVTQFSAALGSTGNYESRSINESISDMFGTAIEFFGQGGTGDYEMGEDLWISGRLRSMSDPNSTQNPDTYGGTHWTTTGSIHINAGVGNFWFYLLCEGGSGTNDLGNNYGVVGIGRNQALAIAYRALTNGFMNATSTYANTRAATIRAAKEIYGSCSNEAVQTANAWYAVGVGTNTYSFNITLSSPLSFISLPALSFYAVNNITSTSTVGTSTAITFRAGNQVILRPGFTAVAGSRFTARIEACTNATIAEARQLAEAAPNVPAADAKEPETGRLLVAPNPTRGETAVTVRLDQDEELVSVAVYNVYHREIKGLLAGKPLPKGEHRLTFNAAGLPSGMYYCMLKTKHSTEIKKILIVR